MTKKLRFEVFKRDSFTCQYCGCKAPDVILHVDHVKPVAKGGEDHMMNLVTSCFDCNMGKKDRELSDSSVISKTIKQMGELQERQEQIELMFEWHRSLSDIKGLEFNMQVKYFNEKICAPRCLNEVGIESFKKAVKKFPSLEILEAIDISARYVDRTSDEALSRTISIAISKLGGILKNNKKQKENPEWDFVVKIYRMLKYYRNRERQGVYMDRVEDIVMKMLNSSLFTKDQIVESVESLLDEGELPYKIPKRMKEDFFTFKSNQRTVDSV